MNDEAQIQAVLGAMGSAVPSDPAVAVRLGARLAGTPGDAAYLAEYGRLLLREWAGEPVDLDAFLEAAKTILRQRGETPAS